MGAAVRRDAKDEGAMIRVRNLNGPGASRQLAWQDGVHDCAIQFYLRCGWQRSGGKDAFRPPGSGGQEGSGQGVFFCRALLLIPLDLLKVALQGSSVWKQHNDQSSPELGPPTNFEPRMEQYWVVPDEE